MTPQQFKKEAREIIISRILSRRSCRSHEPENCNICEERKKIIDLFHDDFLDALITKAYEAGKREQEEILGLRKDK